MIDVCDAPSILDAIAVALNFAAAVMLAWTALAGQNERTDWEQVGKWLSRPDAEIPSELAKAVEAARQNVLGHLLDTARRHHSISIMGLWFLLGASVCVAAAQISERWGPGGCV